MTSMDAYHLPTLENCPFCASRCDCELTAFFSGFKHRFDLTYLISETLPCLPYSAVPFPRNCYPLYSLTLRPLLAETVAWLNHRNNDIPKRCCCCWDEADDD